MKRAKICVQAMMIKNVFAEQGIRETFKQLCDLGFTAIELSQVPMDDESVRQMAEAREEFGIEIPAISAGLVTAPDSDQESLERDFDLFVQRCKILNAQYIRMGALPLQYLMSEDKLIEFSKKCEEYAGKLKEHNIQLYFHNHHAEFQTFDGKTAISVMQEHAPSLGFEIDVHWVWRGGYDPVSIIKTCRNKVDLLHLKDYRIKRLPEVVSEEEREKLFGDYFSTCVQFAEVGEGSLDMKTIIETGLDCGSKYLIIEQDETYDRTPMESLRISGDNLRKLGYGDLF